MAKLKKKRSVAGLDQEKLKKALKSWEKVTQSLGEKIRASEHLTESDFSIRINAKA